MAAIGIDLPLDIEPALGGEAGLAAGERLRGRQQGGGDGAERDRRAGAVLARDDAADDVEVAPARPAGAAAAMSSALSRSLSAATRVAEAVITVAREACAPMPNSMRSVWPWVTRTRSIVDADHLGGDLRHHGLEALAERGAAGDHLDGAGGVDRDPDAVGRPEPALLHEHGDAGADQLAGGAAARADRPAASSTTRRRAPFRAAPCSRRCRSGFPRRALRAGAR